MRTGLIAKKIGITSSFDKAGLRKSVTLLKLDDVRVVGVRNKEKDGYNSVQLGTGYKKERRHNKAQLVDYKKKGIAPKAKVCEFRVSDEGMLKIGQRITCEHFIAGQFVDVAAISKGKGFSGAMKRHNFHGLRASHGVSVSHRSLGSTGQNQDPGKVFKNKKMAGQYGNKRITVQNLKVVEVDTKNDLIVIEGSVPGHNDCYVYVSDAVKKVSSDKLPYPTFIVSEEKENLSQKQDNLAGEAKESDKGVEDTSEKITAESAKVAVESNLASDSSSKTESLAKQDDVSQTKKEK